MSKYKRGTPKHNEWLARRGISYRDVVSRQIEISSGVSRILPGSQVDRLRSKVVDGFQVTINRYNGNDNKVQVFIDDLNSGTTILDYVSLDNVDSFIAINTRRG